MNIERFGVVVFGNGEMAIMSQMIKRRVVNKNNANWLPLAALMLVFFCLPNCMADDVVSQPYDSKRFEELSLKLEKHLREWEELRPAIKRLVSDETDLEFLITELSKMSKLKANPTPEQLNNEKDIVLVDKESIEAPFKLAEKKSLVESEQDETYLGVTNVKAFSVLPVESLERGGQFAIHLASFIRVKNVQLGWLIYQAKYSRVLKGKLPLSMDIFKDGTRYHRLLAGMFESKKHAEGICGELKKFNQYCRVVKYKGEII